MCVPFGTVHHTLLTSLQMDCYWPYSEVQTLNWSANIRGNKRLCYSQIYSNIFGYMIIRLESYLFVEHSQLTRLCRS